MQITEYLSIIIRNAGRNSVYYRHAGCETPSSVDSLVTIRYSIMGQGKEGQKRLVLLVVRLTCYAVTNSFRRIKLDQASVLRASYGPT